MNRQGRGSVRTRREAPFDRRESSMSEGNAATVRAIHEAFDRQDIPEVLELLDGSMEWTVPDTVQYGGHFTGHDGVGAFFAQLPEYFDELNVRIEELVEAGNVVLDLTTISGRGK